MKKGKKELVMSGRLMRPPCGGTERFFLCERADMPYPARSKDS